MTELSDEIRVLHVLPWITAGGVERRRALIAEMSHTPFEHRFFTLQANGANAERIRAAKCEIHELDMRRLKGLRPYLELIKTVREYRPHIIHGAVFEGVTLATVVGNLLRVPVILSEETSEATNRSPRGHALFRFLVSRTDRVVAISPAVEAMLEYTTKVPRKNVRLILNGVEPMDAPTVGDRRASRKSWGLADEDFVLGTMSRLVDDSNKRVSDLIRAMPAILNRCPHAKLLVCGDGVAKVYLVSLAESLGVSENVVFAGNLALPFDGFAAMDVFVHVAQNEGFGLAVAEASFCALPIVTTGVGGIASIVVPGRTATIVPVGDSTAIAKGVLELAADPAMRERYGQAGRQYAVERLSAERYVRDLEGLYHELLAEKKVRL